MSQLQKKGAPGKAIAGAFAAAVVMKIFIFDFMITEGHSMVPSIESGDIMLVCKAYYGIKLPSLSDYLIEWRTPQKGDIVVFYTPLGEIAVKRCGENPDPRDGFFYAVGDNASHSYDSRDYGPVPYSSVIGRVLGVK